MQHKFLNLKTNITASVLVSTVLLPINHGTAENPEFYETMIFGGEHDGAQYRYRDSFSAQRGHDFIVQRLKGGRTCGHCDTTNSDETRTNCVNCGAPLQKLTL